MRIWLTAGTGPHQDEKKKRDQRRTRIESRQVRKKERSSLRLTDFGLGKEDLEISDLEVGDSNRLHESSSLCKTERKQRERKHQGESRVREIEINERRASISAQQELIPCC